MEDDEEPEQDDVTARLGFGFWSMLLSNKAHRERLRPVFKECFLHPTGNSVHLEDVGIKTGDLCELRNAIAHHHPIFGWDFETSTTNISDVAGWMSPPIRGWLLQRSRVLGTEGVLLNNPLR
jgi:hypothetical protein